MAAAQMHAEGRLVRVMDSSDFRQSPNIDDRRDNDTTQPTQPSNDKPSRGRPNTPIAQELGAAALAPK
jgi:hypothetical protein